MCEHDVSSIFPISSAAIFYFPNLICS